jgi:hypothetical protein
MSAPSVHHDWLSLIEISGPFLAVPVLKETFPQGLEELDATKRKRLRQAYEEWREALEMEDVQFAELHVAWIDEVLSRGLELDEDGKGDVLKRADWCAANLKASLPEHGVTLSPDLAVIDEQRANKPLLLIQTYAQDVDLDATLKQDGWAATPADRMVQLCRSLGCRLGLVTNGERWMLVDAPVGAVTTFASWYARIWSQEPITLQAFVHLLGIRRFFVDEFEQLPALFDRSLKFQDEVTDALGEQVRRAVEVLIQTLDKADQDRNRELLHDVKEPELYEAALTVMMRLVFLLSAEERGLLLMGDERYEANYALSTLRMQLRKESEEILERRWDAWSRLLAIFRAVFGGIEHENLRLPALGGSLFDPDRFPFLEGRGKGSNWRSDAAKPLPIDNRTVLLLLEAIQQFQGRTLSYRALDVEQIGYVYEGLLERTVKRTDEVTLELDATKNAKVPWVKLAELDSARLDGAARLADLLQERSGSSASRVRNDLAKPVDDTLADRLLTACQGDAKLRDRIKPYAHLLRTDPWGYPLVYPAGAFIVTTGSDRRETGTHYTPKSLTEAIVAETLTPVAYVGPAEGTPREQWALKSPAELLDLKICDPAMGSGAFLVQACRWLSDRLVEAWSQVEATSRTVSVDGEVLEAGAAKEPLPRDSEARTVIARRLIAERCLYGVDLNPLAVELAKLSIWLVTLAKGRPFGFLDHNLRCGDSLLGIHRLDQLTELSMTPGGKGQQRLFGKNIEQAVHGAIELRQRLREMPIRDIHDVEAMARLNADARYCLEVPERIADAFIGNALALESRCATLGTALESLAIQAGQAIDGEIDAIAAIISQGKNMLAVDLPAGKAIRHPFHWPLEYPEVFSRDRGGFDAVVGNPPFLHGRRVSTTLGSAYLKWLSSYHSEVNGSADLVAYFSIRMFLLIRTSGCSGFIATKTIAEGDTRETSLDWILKNKGYIAHANPDTPWPGSASVRISVIVIWKGVPPKTPTLGGRNVAFINSLLSESTQASTAQPKQLALNKAMVFTGTYVYGKGFVISAERKNHLINLDAKNSKIIRPYLRGEDINRHPTHKHGDWVIDFGGMSESAAREWAHIFTHLEVTVKIERMGQTKQIHEPCFWKHWDKRPELYSKLAGLKECLVHAFVGKHIGFAFVDASQVIATPTAVWPTESRALFAVLQSSFHAVWVIERASKMGTSIRYTPSDCFQPFALPAPLERQELIDVGTKYESYRRRVMEARQEGLTTLYNRFHNQLETSQDIEELRKLHREVDLLVARSYGWPDLEICHGFFDTKQGIRYSIDPNAQRKVLDLLLVLNLQRYQEENQAGLHNRAVKKSKTTLKSSTSKNQGELMFVASEYASSIFPLQVVFDWLQKSDGWHAKADILAATNISDSQWNAAIGELLERGKVERQGEKRGARYRAANAGMVQS